MTEPDEDLIDEIVRGRTATNPGLPALVEAARSKRAAIAARHASHDVEIIEKGSALARWESPAGSGG